MLLGSTLAEICYRTANTSRRVHDDVLRRQHKRHLDELRRLINEDRQLQELHDAIEADREVSP